MGKKMDQVKEKFAEGKKAGAAACGVLSTFILTVTTSDTPGVTEAEWGGLAIGILGVIAVWLVPNKQTK